MRVPTRWAARRGLVHGVLCLVVRLAAALLLRVPARRRSSLSKAHEHQAGLSASSPLERSGTAADSHRRRVSHIPATAPPQPHTQDNARPATGRDGSGHGSAGLQAPRRPTPSRYPVRAIRTRQAQGPPRRAATKARCAPTTRQETGADETRRPGRVSDRACPGAGGGGRPSRASCLADPRIHPIGSAPPRRRSPTPRI